MSPENKKLIQAAAKEAADHLIGKLPPALGLSKRNAHAHVWERIKSKMGRSYKDCSDDQVDVILEIIAFHRANP